MRMRMIALIVAVAMLSIAIAYKLSSPGPSVAVAQGGSGTATTTATMAAALVDSDGDGVPDWQEELYGSDPHDPASIPATTTPIEATTTASSTVTASLADRLLSTYLSQTNGGSQPVDNTYQFGTSIASQYQPDIQYAVYLGEEAQTDASTPANRAAYEQELEAALLPVQRLPEAEITTYGRMVAGDPSAAGELQQTIDTYDSAIADAKKVVVPKDALVVHVGAINALGYYAATLQAMHDTTDDPVGSLVLLQAYNEAERNMVTSFDALRTYFRTHATTTARS